MRAVIEVGTILGGKFRVIRQIGYGGMGSVYEVEHTLTRHRRALKLLHKEMADIPAIVTRFLREASAARHR
jgi:serine/threonine-protein kinase